MKLYRGFSLIELILVIGIIGILCVMVIPLFYKFLPGTRLESACKILAEDLRLARSFATTTQRPHGLVFEVGGDSYYMYDGQLSNLAQDPLTKKSLNRDYKLDGRFKGVDIAEVTFPNGQVEFNSLGSPDAGGSIILESNQARKTISVEAGTGKVRITGG